MVNVGIIGAGRIGKVHVESICTQVKDAKVKMLADPFMNDETAKWAKDMGVEAVTKEYKEILADPEIDAVLICSSTDTHSPISVEAIKAGKHVFCEKPIDHDVAKIKEVIDALKDSNVKYQVGFNRRFDHNFEAVQKAVADGKIGDTHIIKITSRDPEPPCADYVKVSGGIFLDMTIHDTFPCRMQCNRSIRRGSRTGRPCNRRSRRCRYGSHHTEDGKWCDRSDR